MGNSPSALNQCLTAAVGGNADLVAFSGEPLYQILDVKPYNLDIPVDPAAITYPETNEQVAEIVKCAVANNMKVQARSGGHSYANFCLGGGENNIVVVDLKNMQQFSMDTTTWEASIGAGHLLGDVTDKLIANGNRAMAHGTCPQVGIGGHATIGGLGPPSRMWGMALDHIVETTVVLANSSIVKASETQNSDLFFALKGAGAGFGIITEFKVRTQPAPGNVVEYRYAFTGRPYANFINLFMAWQTIVSDPALSRKFASQVIFSELGMIITGTYFGPRSEFDALNLTAIFPVQPDLSEFSSWAGAVGHWAEDVALELGGGIPAAFYSKNLVFTPQDLIPQTGVESMMQYFETVDKGTLLWFAIFDLAGGAVNDVPMDATAFAHRDALFYLQSYAIDLIGGVDTITRSFIVGLNDVIVRAVPSVGTRGMYPGYVDPMVQNAQSQYWGSNLPKLEAVKRAVDPNDVFHNPQSVRPAA